jgi:hypothetical protein
MVKSWKRLVSVPGPGHAQHFPIARPPPTAKVFESAALSKMVGYGPLTRARRDV